jgi:hypothetical protein
MRRHEKAWVNRWMFLPPTLRLTSTLVRGPMTSLAVAATVPHDLARTLAQIARLSTKCTELVKELHSSCLEHKLRRVVRQIRGRHHDLAALCVEEHDHVAGWISEAVSEIRVEPFRRQMLVLARPFDSCMNDKRHIFDQFDVRRLLVHQYAGAISRDSAPRILEWTNVRCARMMRLELLGCSTAKTFENRQLIKNDLIYGHNALECFFVKMKCLVYGWTHDRIKHLKSAVGIH